MPSNNDVQEQQQRQQQQQLFAPSKLIEMTYLGDPGYCFLIANGFAFTLWYRMMLHALGRDSLWVPKGLAFKIGCTIAEEPSSYKQIYDKWFRHWLSRDVKHRTAFANAYCDGNHYKPVVVAAINRARQTMTKTFDRSKAREVLETELSRENVAPEDLFKDSPTNTKDLWEQGTVQRPEKIHANIMGDNKAIWNGLRRPYPGPPHYVRRWGDAQHHCHDVADNSLGYSSHVGEGSYTEQCSHVVPAVQ